MWENGILYLNSDKYFYSVKVYDEPSKFGIDGGRISKLEIRDKDTNLIIGYDRGDWWLGSKEQLSDYTVNLILENPSIKELLRQIKDKYKEA